MSDRAIVVTGASGYVGTAAVRALVSAGFRVYAVGRTDPRIAGVQFQACNLLDDGGVDAVLSGIGAPTLLHLAWSVAPGRFWTDSANLDWVAASLRLARAFAAAGGRRLVGVGSCAEYDWTEPLLHETATPIRPRSLYGRAKAAVHDLWAALGEQEGMAVAWARLFFMYGPGEPREKLVAQAVTRLLAGERVQTSAGTQRRDFIHVGDVGRALAMLAAGDATGAFNIGSGAAVAVRDLLGMIEVATGANGLIDFGARPLQVGEPPELVADTRRLHGELGFRPEFDNRAGIADTVSWWLGERSQGAGESRG